MKIKIFDKLKARFDALVDPLTSRGSSLDKTVRTRGRIAVNSNDYNLALYMANGFVQNIVDQPAEDATREWIKIRTNIDNEDRETDEEKDISALIDTRLKDLKLQGKIKDLIRYSRMYSKGAFMYYGILGENIQNRENLKKPLPEIIQSIDFINVIDDSDRVSILFDNKTDPLIKSYNQPKFSMSGYEIHPSRLSWLVNSWIPKYETGISVIQTIEDAIKAQDSGLWSTNSILGFMALKIFTSDEIAGLSAEQKGELLAKIRHLLDTQSVMALKSDEDFKQLAFSVSGIKEIYEYIFDNLSGMSRFPRKVLLGQAHGIVTGAEYDTLNYFNQIAKFNENQVREIIQKVINIVCSETRGEVYQAIGEREYEVTFEFNSLWKLDPLSQADIDLKKSQRDQIDVTIGKVNPAELRQLDERYTGLEPYEMDRLNMDEPRLPGTNEEIDKILEKKLKEKEVEKKEEPIKADKADIREEKQTVQIFPIEVNIDNTKQPEKIKIKKTIKITTDSKGKINGGIIEEIDNKFDYNEIHDPKSGRFGSGGKNKIYKNSLGEPVYEASISTFGRYGEEEGHLALKGVGDIPDKKWKYTEDPIELNKIKEEMQKEGWEVKSFGYSAYHGETRGDFEHISSREAYQKEREKIKEDIASAEPAWIRYGKPPKNGISYNYRDNIPEKGVSVFKSYIGKSGSIYHETTGQSQASLYSVQDRPKYKIFGEQIGTGSDGEPVIKMTSYKRINKKDKENG